MSNHNPSRPVRAFLPDDLTRAGPSLFAQSVALQIRAAVEGIPVTRMIEDDRRVSSRLRTVVEKAVGAIALGGIGDDDANREFLTGLRSAGGVFDGALSSMRQVARATRVMSATMVTASSVDEAAYKPLSGITLDDGGRLTDRKAAAIVAYTRELAMAPGFVAFIENELRRGMTAGTEEIFVGALEQLVTPLVSSGNDADSIRQDLRTMIEAVNLNAESKPFWVFPVSLATALSFLQARLGSEGESFGPLGGRLLTFPAYVTDALEDDQAALFDATKVAADGGVVLFKSSTQAALQMSATPDSGAQSLVSLWQTNSAAGMVERLFAFDLLGTDAAIVMNECNWGEAVSV